MTTPNRVIPTLPDEYEGSPVEWTRWMLAPILSHVPSGCFTCDHEGPLSLTFGLFESTGRKRRLLAVRCRRCQETRVSTFQPLPDGPRVFKRRLLHDAVPEGVEVEDVVHGEQIEVAYFPPQALGEDL